MSLVLKVLYLDRCKSSNWAADLPLSCPSVKELGTFIRDAVSKFLDDKGWPGDLPDGEKIRPRVDEAVEQGYKQVIEALREEA